jgi:recombination protein RecA
VGTARLIALPARVTRASAEATAPSRAPLWALADLSGRLVELSAGTEAAHLTAAVGLVLEAQLSGDRAAWVTLGHHSFFPPDVADSGIDLASLPVVLAPDARTAGRAADHLVRSGGFGLVVIDLSNGTTQRCGPDDAVVKPDDERLSHRTTLSVPLLTRLLGLARQQDVAVLLLTRKSADAPSMHSLIALRAEAQWRWRDGRCEIAIRVIKDKRSGAGWTHVEACHGPAGLR